MASAYEHAFHHRQGGELNKVVSVSRPLTVWALCAEDVDGSISLSFEWDHWGGDSVRDWWATFDL